MIEIDSRVKMENLIKAEAFVLFYLSRPSCGVCLALKPKIMKLTEKYANLKTYYLNLDKDETVSGQFSIFTIPAILVYVNGQEAIREARFISVEEFDSKLDRIAGMLEES